MKHYLTFSEPSALIEKAKWLENVGFKILDNTVETAIRDSNPRRFKKATEKVLDKWFNYLSDMESQLSK